MEERSGEVRSSMVRREKSTERVKKKREIVSSESVFGGGATGG